MIHMDFDIKPRGAGSVGAILQDADIASIYGMFGDGCLRYYGMDIRTKRRCMDKVALNQVRSFVKEYGTEDARKIIGALFGVAHEGLWRGQPVGNAIFSKSHRWMADKLLMEAERSGMGAMANVNVVADDNAARLEHVKDRIKRTIASGRSTG